MFLFVFVFGRAKINFRFKKQINIVFIHIIFLNVILFRTLNLEDNHSKLKNKALQSVRKSLNYFLKTINVIILAIFLYYNIIYLKI